MGRNKTYSSKFCCQNVHPSGVLSQSKCVIVGEPNNVALRRHMWRRYCGRRSMNLGDETKSTMVMCGARMMRWSLGWNSTCTNDELRGVSRGLATDFSSDAGPNCRRWLHQNLVTAEQAVTIVLQ